MKHSIKRLTNASVSLNVAAAGKQNVSCKFEDSFICGYTTVALGDLSWEQTDSRTLGFDESGGEFHVCKFAVKLTTLCRPRFTRNVR